MRFAPEPGTKNWITARLASLKLGTAVSILAMQTPGDTYSKETLLRKALINLAKLAVTKHWPTKLMIIEITIPCWDAGIFVSHDEVQAEARWQETEIEPKIEEEFRRMWAEEDEFRRQRNQHQTLRQPNKFEVLRTDGSFTAP